MTTSISASHVGTTQARRWKLPLQRAGLAAAVLLVGFTAGWELWAVWAWVRYDHVSMIAPDPVIAPFMPRYEIAERHTTVVNAAPAVVFETVKTFRLEDSRIVHSIFAARELIFGQQSANSETPPFLQSAREMGWGLLDSIATRQVVFGAITQPWKGNVRFRALPPAQFNAFDSAGYAKIVWSIAVDSLGPRQSRVRTETRVATTDPSSRRRFRRYWSTFSPGILLIRRETLRTIRSAAERSEKAREELERRRSESN